MAAIAVVGIVAGALFFGLRGITLLSGTTVPLGDGILRIAAVVVYVGLSMTGLVAVGLFFSTLTEVPGQIKFVDLDPRSIRSVLSSTSG